MAVALKPAPKGYSTAATALSAGITMPAGSQQLIQKFQHYTYDNIYWKLAIQTSSLRATIAAAALGFGQALLTLPQGVIRPLGATIRTQSLTTGAGATGTAGEVGLGTTLATGAIATLGAGSAAMENISEGVTIANHVVGTTLVSRAASQPVAAFDHGAGAIVSSANPGSGGIIDNTGGAAQVFFNMASTFGAAGTVDVVAYVVMHYQFLGTDFGYE